MYRTIETSIWSDKKFQGLPAPGKLLFLYLITSPHAHVAGIYRLPPLYLEHETTLRPEAIDRVWDTLSKSDMAKRDTSEDLVWVCNMFRYQARGEKNERAAARQLKSLPKSPLVHEFLTKYPQVSQYMHDTLSNRVSDPSGYPPGPYPLEQSRAEQDQSRADQLRPSDACGEPADAGKSPLTSPSSVAKKRSLLSPMPAKGTDAVAPVAVVDYPTFPCVAGRRSSDATWLLTDAQMGKWSATFPAVDVPAECRRAHAWVDANPTHRKTANGMKEFLFRWLSRVQNRGGSGSSAGPPGHPRAVDRDQRREAELEQALAARRPAG